MIHTAEDARQNDKYARAGGRSAQGAILPNPAAGPSSLDVRSTLHERVYNLCYKTPSNHDLAFTGTAPRGPDEIIEKS